MTGIMSKAGAYQLAFQAQDITSSAMKAAIEDWFRLYYLQEATKEEDPCQQIPHTIVRKLTKTTFSEYTATSKDTFAAQVLMELWMAAPEGMQKALIGGVSYLKPVPTKNGFRFLTEAAGNPCGEHDPQNLHDPCLRAGDRLGIVGEDGFNGRGPFLRAA